MSGVVNFRPATLADARQIAALIMSHQPLLTIDPTGQGARQLLESVCVHAIAGYIDSMRYAYIVAEDGGDLAGFIAVRDNSHVYHLFVSASHQGKGLARDLWQRARRQAESAGNTGEFTVNSSPNALPVYERFGFKPMGPLVEQHGIAFIPMRLARRSDGA